MALSPADSKERILWFMAVKCSFYKLMCFVERSTTDRTVSHNCIILSMTVALFQNLWDAYVDDIGGSRQRKKLLTNVKISGYWFIEDHSFINSFILLYMQNWQGSHKMHWQNESKMADRIVNKIIHLTKKKWIQLNT